MMTGASQSLGIIDNGRSSDVTIKLNVFGQEVSNSAGVFRGKAILVNNDCQEPRDIADSLTTTGA